MHGVASVQRTNESDVLKERDSHHCWYVCVTRSRHEKRANEVLLRRGIESYLPLRERRSRWKDRWRVVLWPLFPGYLFVRFRLRELVNVLSTPGLATVVRVNGYPTPIRDAEIENMRRFVDALLVTGLVPRPVSGLHVGQRVRVIEGPFRGVECVVTRRRGRRRIVVELPAIGRGLEVNLGVDVVEPIGVLVTCDAGSPLA
jgi:transcription termination/antitermination protein NusG